MRRRSRWYLSEPVPPSDQPWYVNAVAAVETALAPLALLDALLALEAGSGGGAARPTRPAPSTSTCSTTTGAMRHARLMLPHPRLHERRFVLAPLAEIAPEWRHPRSGNTAAALLAALPPGSRSWRPMAGP